jgi:hypothetical protein
MLHSGGGGVQTGSTRHVGHLLAYCTSTCPGWLWGWRIWWNEWQGKPKYLEKTCPDATLSTTNPTWPDPGLNPGRRGGKPATNRFSYGAAYFLCYVVSKYFNFATISKAIQRDSKLLSRFPFTRQRNPDSNLESLCVSYLNIIMLSSILAQTSIYVQISLLLLPYQPHR